MVISPEKFHDDKRTGTLLNMCDKRTDGQNRSQELLSLSYKRNEANQNILHIFWLLLSHSKGSNEHFWKLWATPVEHVAACEQSFGICFSNDLAPNKRQAISSTNAEKCAKKFEVFQKHCSKCGEKGVSLTLFWPLCMVLMTLMPSPNFSVSSSQGTWISCSTQTL